MANNKRTTKGYAVQDPSAIATLQYNESAGSQKVSEVGRKLLPIAFDNAGTIAYTTDATTIRRLPSVGMNIAVYNNSAAVHAITLGETAAQAALAAGVTDATGHVGIPCAANSWTYIASGLQPYVISDSVALLVFIIDDNTSIVRTTN